MKVSLVIVTQLPLLLGPLREETASAGFLVITYLPKARIQPSLYPAEAAGPGLVAPGSVWPG